MVNLLSLLKFHFRFHLFNQAAPSEAVDTRAPLYRRVAQSIGEQERSTALS